MLANTNLGYSILLIKAMGNYSFNALGHLINKSGDTVRRLIRPAEENFSSMAQIAQQLFCNRKNLYLIIDDTLIKKIHSSFMRGSGRFYDTKLGRKITAYKLLCSAISDGKVILPLNGTFLFDKELLTTSIISKNDLVKKFVSFAIKLFPVSHITVILDGAFATKDFLLWCFDMKIATEVRMHSNRRVMYKGKFIAIRNIESLKPKGRHMARTIDAIWHDIPLQITAQRRINKHGDETIIYQAATFKSKPSKHVAIYKKRWPIEKMFRTIKQHLGLEKCYSTSMNTQLNHISSVLLAYSFIQLEAKYNKMITPEAAIRASSIKNIQSLHKQIYRLAEIFGVNYA